MANKKKQNIVDQLVITQSLEIQGTLTRGGVTVDSAVLLGTGEVVDLNGEADALVLDADADTSISSPTDDQIDFELKSVDHVVMKAVAVADSAATTNIVEIAATSPVDTTGTNTHNALNIDLEIGNASGGTNNVRAIAIDNITGDAQVTTTGVLLGTGFDIGLDMQGTKLELDADNDTSIIASTDDQIDIEVSGAIDFVITANTLTAVSGSTIATNTIAETTAASGVTIDGVLLKDGGAVFADAATIEIDTVNEATAAAGVTVDGLLIKDNRIGVKQAITGDGAITIQHATVYLSKAGAAAITLAAPTSGTHDGLRITVIATSAQAHVITSGVDGFNAKGSSGTATFGGAIGDSVTFEADAGHWYTVATRNVTIA